MKNEKRNKFTSYPGGIHPDPPEKVYVVLNSVISFVYVKCHVCVHILSFLLDKVDLFAHKLSGVSFTHEREKERHKILNVYI